MPSQFERSTLLAIHRQFTENEAVKFVEQQLSAASYEIGLLKSDLAESNDLSAKATTQLSIITSEKENLEAALLKCTQQINNLVEQIAIANKKIRTLNAEKLENTEVHIHPNIQLQKENDVLKLFLVEKNHIIKGLQQELKEKEVGV